MACLLSEAPVIENSTIMNKDTLQRYLTVTIVYQAL